MSILGFVKKETEGCWQDAKVQSETIPKLCIYEIKISRIDTPVNEQSKKKQDRSFYSLSNSKLSKKEAIKLLRKPYWCMTAKEEKKAERTINKLFNSKNTPFTVEDVQ